MTRNTRLVKNWIEESVVDFEVAPHRYTWDRVSDEDDFADPHEHRISTWKAALPYSVGEIIWVESNGKPYRAKIISVLSDFHHGSRRAIYQCQLETGQGLFSKVWKRFYPGHVQRGYMLAGLAPDLEGKI